MQFSLPSRYLQTHLSSSSHLSRRTCRNHAPCHAGKSLGNGLRSKSNTLPFRVCSRWVIRLCRYCFCFWGCPRLTVFHCTTVLHSSRLYRSSKSQIRAFCVPSTHLRRFSHYSTRNSLCLLSNLRSSVLCRSHLSSFSSHAAFFCAQNTLKKWIRLLSKSRGHALHCWTIQSRLILK